jgi:hypothetical protein
MFRIIFGFTQSSDFFHLSTNYSENTLWDPTKYIYLESARRDLLKSKSNFLVSKKFLKKLKKKILDF